MTLPKEVPTAFKPFIRYALKTIKDNFVTLRIVNEAGIAYEEGSSILCNGYFDDDPTPVLAVAIGKPFHKWFPTFIHEFCHMEQWLYDSATWNITALDEDDPDVIRLGLEDVGSALAYIDNFLADNSNKDNQMLDRCLRSAAMLEMDCERRVVEKIKEWNLPLNTQEYIQKANSYVYMYLYMKECGKWYTVDNEPYNNPNIWMAAPLEFDLSLTEIPTKLLDAYRKHL